MTRRSSLSQRGFFCEPAFLAPGEIEALGDELGVLARAMLGTLPSREPHAPSGDSIQDLGAHLAELERGRSGAAEHFAPLTQNAPALARLAADPSLIALARETLAETIALEGPQRLLVLEPGANEPIAATTPASGTTGSSLQALIPLQPVGPDRGAVWLAPGLHRSGSADSTAMLGQEGRIFSLQPSLQTGIHEEFRWDAEAGDLLLRDPRLPVTFEPNRTTRALFYLAFQYADLAGTALRQIVSSAATEPSEPAPDGGADEAATSHYSLSPVVSGDPSSPR